MKRPRPFYKGGHWLPGNYEASDQATGVIRGKMECIDGDLLRATPATARRFAKWLIDAADWIDQQQAGNK